MKAKVSSRSNGDDNVDGLEKSDTEDGLVCRNGEEGHVLYVKVGYLLINVTDNFEERQAMKEDVKGQTDFVEHDVQNHFVIEVEDRKKGLRQNEVKEVLVYTVKILNFIVINLENKVNIGKSSG